MGLRMRKTIKLAPGVKLNLNRKSVGVSVGGKVAGVNFNSRTGTTARVSAPGTGMSYTTKVGGSTAGKKQTGTQTEPAVQPTYRKYVPVPLRWWYIAIAVCFVIAAIGGVAGVTEGGTFQQIIGCAAIGAVMLVFTVRERRNK